MDALLPVTSEDRPIDLFRSELQEICGQFQVEPKERSPVLLSHLSVQHLSGIDLAHVGLNAQHVTRCWSCPVYVPVSQLIYAAFCSKAKGLLPPSDECLRRGL